MGVFMNGNDWATSTTSYSRASSDHTVMYWLRLDSNASVRRPLGNAGLWEARTNGGGANPATLTSDYLQSGTLGTVSLTVGTIYHIAFVQDVTNSQRLAYTDGVLTGTVVGATFAGTQNGNINIGVSPGGAGQGWFGVIDDVRIYNRVMTANEILTIYTLRGQDGILDNLQHHWPLDEGAEGTTVTALIDVVAGLNCTTINNTPVYNYDLGITQLVA